MRIEEISKHCATLSGMRFQIEIATVFDDPSVPIVILPLFALGLGHIR